MPSVVASGSRCSSWSVASISTVSRISSIGAPRSRSASDRSPPAPLLVSGCRVRVRLSGLYWKTITLASGLIGSMPTIAPLTRRGEPGKVVIASSLVKSPAAGEQRADVEIEADPLVGAGQVELEGQAGHARDRDVAVLQQAERKGARLRVGEHASQRAAADQGGLADQGD